MLGMELYWAALTPVIVKVTVTMLLADKDGPVCLSTIYRVPSLMFLFSFKELRSLSMVIEVELIAG